jgi:hypothetical protein
VGDPRYARRDHVLVVGCQRSGTSVVWAALTAHPELRPKRAYDPETGYDPKELYYFRNIFAARAQFPSPMYGWDVDREYLRRIVDLTIEFCAEHHGSSSGRWVNAHPADGLHLAAMLEVMPEVRVVHVLRHPQEVVWSMLHAPWSKNEGRHVTDPLRRHAMHWRHFAQLALDMRAGRFGNQVIEVRHEEIERSPDVVARRLIEHVGLTPDPAVQRQLEMPTFNSSFKNDVPARQLFASTRRAIARDHAFRRRIVELVGHEMEALGYRDLGNPPLVPRPRFERARPQPDAPRP